MVFVILVVLCHSVQTAALSLLFTLFGHLALERGRLQLPVAGVSTYELLDSLFWIPFLFALAFAVLRDVVWPMLRGTTRVQRRRTLRAVCWGL